MHLFIEHLTVIDCAYLCERHGIVGESWITDVTLIGALDGNAMVMDFAKAKKAVKEAIDSWIDHTLLVPTRSPNLSLYKGEDPHDLKADTEGHHQHTLSFTFGDVHALKHASPAQALCLIDAERITPEAARTYLETRLPEVLPGTVERVEITLRTESAGEPYYHYAHGLKKHYGNCQRIAHGHRSRLRIFRDAALDTALTAAWAEKLNHTYIGTREDIIGADETHTHFAYLAPQGPYELSYPTALCYLIDTDSTVECIASHIAAEVKRTHPESAITARACEGVMKGAVAFA